MSSELANRARTALYLRIAAAVFIGVWAWKIYSTWGLFLGAGVAILILF